MTPDAETPRVDAVALDEDNAVYFHDAPEECRYIEWTDYWALLKVARELERELAAVRAERDDLKYKLITADALADAVASLVVRKVIDERSLAADALLDYRNPPRTERSDLLAAAEARARECERLMLLARQYVSDAGDDEDSESQRMSAELLAAIDAARTTKEAT